MQCLWESHHPSCRFCYSANTTSWIDTEGRAVWTAFGWLCLWWFCPSSLLLPPLWAAQCYSPCSTCAWALLNSSGDGLCLQTGSAHSWLRSAGSYRFKFPATLNFKSTAQTALPHLCAGLAQWRANQELKGLCCSDLGIKVLIEMTAHLRIEYGIYCLLLS